MTRFTKGSPIRPSVWTGKVLIITDSASHKRNATTVERGGSLRDIRGVLDSSRCQCAYCQYLVSQYWYPRGE